MTGIVVTMLSFRKAYGHILEELIAPDILLSDLNGCRKILRNAKRFLNGHTKTNCVYIKYEWWLGPVDTSHSAKLMSDKEINNRSDLKNFSKVFFKECLSSGKSEYENHLSEKTCASLQLLIKIIFSHRISPLGEILY
uniref:hypothetical protein n=1 Tax=Enterobacter cloacae complex sp. TaxID=2027919 RepID=UPI00210010D7|nr:hypothetical protein [Enterobacter cloacae complex sp.]